MVKKYMISKWTLIPLICSQSGSIVKRSIHHYHRYYDLNRISDIPIHRTSNKYKKIGSGVVYYNNPADLLDRLELLGGSILAGNNGVKNEFSKIAHTLNKLGVLNNTQLNSLLKEYVI